MARVRFMVLQVTLSSRIAEDSRRVKQRDKFPARLIYAFSAFHQLYPDMVRAFDKGGPQSPACEGARPVGHFDAVFLQTFQRLLKAVHAESDVVGHVALGGFEVGAVLPELGPFLLGILHGENDEVDVVHHQRHCRANLVTPVEARFAGGRPSAAADQPEFFDIPFAGRDGVLAQQMDVAEVVMIGRVQLDQLVVRPVHVSKKEDPLGIAAANVADVRDWRGELCAAVELLLVSLLHVLRAPADVPDGRGDLRLRRRAGLVEQKPRLLRPHGITEPWKFYFLAIEFAGVKLDGRCRISGVQMDVVEVCERRWRRPLTEAKPHHAQNQNTCAFKASWKHATFYTSLSQLLSPAGTESNPLHSEPRGIEISAEGQCGA